MYYWKLLKHIDDKLVSKTINSVRIKYNFKKYNGENNPLEVSIKL